MLSHPERVRRNYHNIEIYETVDPQTGDVIVTTKISRAEIASRMSKRDVQKYIYTKYLDNLKGSN